MNPEWFLVEADRQQAEFDAMSDKISREATPEEAADFNERVGQAALDQLEAVRDQAALVLKSSESGERKLDRLIQLATDFTSAIDHVTACKGRGCSHCCKMSVNITEREARRIAAHTGLTMARIPVEHDPEAMMERLELDVERYATVPCPFLAGDDSCSIYEVRPLACVLAHSLEDTPDKCDLTTGRHWVRRLNTNAVSIVLAVTDINRPLADIRDFFP